MVSIKGLLKLDSWSNIVSGLGGQDDPREGYKLSPDDFGDDEAANLYDSDPTAEKIVNLIPDMMTDSGITISAEPELKATLELQLERLNFFSKINQALKWSRLDGAGYVLIQNGDKTLSEPLPAHCEIKNLIVYTRGDLKADTKTIDTTPGSPWLDLPLIYEKESQAGKLRIHRSRLIIFAPKNCSKKKYLERGYCGISVLSKLHKSVRDYNFVSDNSATLSADINTGILQIENLQELLAGKRKDDENDDRETQASKISLGEKMLMSRIRTMKAVKSVIGFIITDKREQFNYIKRDVSGIKDLVQISKERIQAGTIIPATKLWGISPSGLGASGDSEQKDFAQAISSLKESDLRGPVNKVLSLLAMGKPFSFTFNPVHKKSLAESLEEKKAQAEIDQKYYQMNALSSDEIRESRFSETGYSFETTLSETEDKDKKDFKEEQNKEGGDFE